MKPTSAADRRLQQQREVMMILQQRIAAGEHSDRFRTVCEQCREWCDGFYHHTADGKWICKGCWQRAGGREVIHAEARDVVGRTERDDAITDGERSGGGGYVRGGNGGGRA